MKSLFTYVRYAFAALILYLVFGRESFTEHSSPGLRGSGR